MRCPRCGNPGRARPNLLYLGLTSLNAWVLWLFLANVTATTPGFWENFTIVGWWLFLIMAMGDTFFTIVFTLGRLAGFDDKCDPILTPRPNNRT